MNANKLNCYHIAFTSQTRVTKWRKIPADQASNPMDALIVCLRQIQVKTLKRLERRKATLNAHVAKPGSVCHENGAPMITQGFSLSFAK